MKKVIIGRVTEQKILAEIFQSKKAEFVAVFGRRRVGKTFLIEQFFKQESCGYFQLTGLRKGTLKEQLTVFAKTMSETFFASTGLKMEAPKSWMHAFELLTNTTSKLTKQKNVLFFDELPWLASKKSDFKKALDHYWNTKWSKDNKMILVVCGSAASWIIKNIINDKGGLHNRITLQLPLYPLSLQETFDYLNHKQNKFDQQQVLELYMTLGGIPHYLNQVKANLSATQNISNLFFTRNGQLLHEFDRLFSSLFDKATAYTELVKIIATKKNGVPRKYLEQKAKLSQSGGTLTERLIALEQAGFIKSFVPIGYTDKGINYKLIDEYCLFYLTWVNPIKRQLENEVEPHYWATKYNTPAWHNWAGYAFESICLKHISQIKKALFIPAGTLANSWHFQPDKNKDNEGAQVDLLFDRNDNVVTLCEIKYCRQPFEIDKKYALDLERKIRVFKQQSKISKQVFISMITTNGLKKNKYSEELVTSKATLEDLFSS